MLVFVDCEATRRTADNPGELTEFGAVCPHFETSPGVGGLSAFHGIVRPSLTKKREHLPTCSVCVGVSLDVWSDNAVIVHFDDWLVNLEQETHTRPVFVSDNPAFDWAMLDPVLWRVLGYNPFGHSARRIADYYAGLTGNWHNTQRWKRLRKPVPHDHNPVHDALGNYHAWRRMQAGDR